MKQFLSPIRSVLVVVILFNLSFAGFCDNTNPVAALRGALRSAPALVDALIASGAIPEAHKPIAKAASQDFLDAGEIALNLKVRLDAIPKDAPDLRQQQARAVHTAYNGWRAIVARGHFTIHPRIQTAFNIADGIFVFVDAYFGDLAGETTHADVGADGLSQDEFEKAIDSKIKELKESLKP